MYVFDPTGGLKKKKIALYSGKVFPNSFSFTHLTLGLEYGSKAIGEVLKVHFGQSSGCIQQIL